MRRLLRSFVVSALAAVSGGPALAEWVAAGAPLPHVAPGGAP